MEELAPEVSVRALARGRVLGRYELLLPVAKGGMAEVWAARLRGSRGFQKIFAIKTILPHAIEDTRMERMLLDEASLAAEIRHPNVVETLELGEAEGTLYLVMEWIDGEPLGRVLELAKARGGLPLRAAVNLAAQVCRGLHAAHELADENGAPLGIVHRDVSPQNILVTHRGAAKLVDFGIAKATNLASALTEHGEVKGKFSYMAPEQVRGEHIDRRADVFALGIVLYLATTGRHPFKGQHPAEIVQRIASRHPPAKPSTLVKNYPAALQGVVMRALAKARDERFDSAQEMLAALERAMPEAFDAAFESELAQYMQLLLAASRGARQKKIRAAQLACDTARGDDPTKWGSSISSLRAVAMDPSQLDSESLRIALGSGTLPSLSPAPRGLSRLRQHKAWVIGGLSAAVLLIALVVGLAGGNAQTAAPAAPPALEGPAPAAPVLAAPAATAQTPPSEMPAAVQAEALPVDAPVDAPASAAPKKSARRVAARPAPAPAVPADAPDGTKSPAPAEPERAKSGDAWDPSNFGGRY
jgi:serine/threonine-protein kinase